MLPSRDWLKEGNMKESCTACWKFSALPTLKGKFDKNFAFLSGVKKKKSTTAAYGK